MDKHLIASLDALNTEYGSDLELGVDTPLRLQRFAQDCEWIWLLIDINSQLGIRSTPGLYTACSKVWHAYSEYYRAFYSESPTDYSLAWDTSSGEPCQ